MVTRSQLERGQSLAFTVRPNHLVVPPFEVWTPETPYTIQYDRALGVPEFIAFTFSGPCSIRASNGDEIETTEIQAYPEVISTDPAFQSLSARNGWLYIPYGGIWNLRCNPLAGPVTPFSVNLLVTPVYDIGDARKQTPNAAGIVVQAPAIVGGASVGIALARINRNYLYIANDSTNIVYVSHNVAAVLGTGYVLAPRGSHECVRLWDGGRGDSVPKGTLFAIATGAGSNVSVIEGI